MRRCDLLSSLSMISISERILSFREGTERDVEYDSLLDAPIARH